MPDINDFHTIKSYFSNSLQDIEEVYFEPSQEGYQYSTKEGTEVITEEDEYNAMKTNVEKNHGFYIRRYEAGNDRSNNVIIQKGATVYNNIPWVTSTLVYGVQWDATMQFMDHNYIKENEDECAENSYVRNSEGKGWYSTDEDKKVGTTKTGYYEYKHIYDMAGNVAEWTMEAYDTDTRVFRGCLYVDAGARYPASSRNYYGFPDGSYGNIGFHLALYL